MFHKLATRRICAQKKALKKAFTVKDVRNDKHVEAIKQEVNVQRSGLPWPNKEAWLAEYGVTKEEFKAFKKSILISNSVVAPFGRVGRYEKNRKEGKDFNDTYPWAIVFASGVVDVETIIKFALGVSRSSPNKKEIPLCVRSGGHCYNGYSVIQKGIVIDLSGLNNVTVAPDLSSATVGPGCRFRQLYNELNAYGLVVHGGTCPDVAIGGFVMGGGFGYLARKFGAPCDSLIGLTIVTINEKKETEVRFVNEQTEIDLLWAHRGGTGGNYGVVTSLTFKPHQLPDPKNVWGMSIVFPEELATDVFLAWQHNYTADPGASKDFSSFFNFTWMDTSPSGMKRRWNSYQDEKLTLTAEEKKVKTLKGCIEIDGIYPNGHATEDQVWEYFKPLLDVYKKSTDPYWQNPKTNLGLILKRNAFPQISTWLDDCGGEDIPDTIYEQTRCAYSNRAWNTEDFNKVYNYFKNSPSVTYNITLESYGGQINQVGRTDTAFVHRSAYYNVVVEGCWGSKKNPDDPPQSGAFKFIDDAFTLLETNNLISEEVYQNYPTADRYHFPRAQILNSYFRENLSRLQSIKSKYNPLDIFAYPQGVEQSEKSLKARTAATAALAASPQLQFERKKTKSAE